MSGLKLFILSWLLIEQKKNEHYTESVRYFLTVRDRWRRRVFDGEDYDLDTKSIGKGGINICLNFCLLFLNTKHKIKIKLIKIKPIKINKIHI